MRRLFRTLAVGGREASLSCLLSGLAVALVVVPAWKPARCAAGVLVAHWDFEEGTADQPAEGVVPDRSGAGHHARPAGGPIYRAEKSPSAPGALSLDFNGVDQHLFAPDAADFRLTNEFTVSLFFMVRTPPAEGSRAVLVARGGEEPGHDAFSLALEGEELVFAVEDAEGNRATSERPLISAGVWHRVGGIYDKGAITLSLGRSLFPLLMSSVEPRRDLMDVDAPGVYIGGRPGEFFDGLIDDVRIENRALFPNDFGFSVFGDVNNDGAVDLGDLNLLRNTVGSHCGAFETPADANRDGCVDLADLNIIRNNFGNRIARSPTSAVPEPSAWRLIAAASLVLIMMAPPISSASILGRARAVRRASILYHPLSFTPFLGS